MDKGGITPINHSVPGNRVKVNRYAPHNHKTHNVNPFLRAHNAPHNPGTPPV